MGWKVNWWARLLEGNHAYKLIQNQLSPFYQVDRIAEPGISPIATISLPVLKETVLYDVPAVKGKVYTLTAKQLLIDIILTLMRSVG